MKMKMKKYYKNRCTKVNFKRSTTKGVLRSIRSIRLVSLGKHCLHVNLTLHFVIGADSTT